jgi:PAS domain-containing protein
MTSPRDESADERRFRLVELALRETEQRFSLLVEGITDYAIYMLDPNGIVTSWNRGAQRIKGYRTEEHFDEPKWLVAE